MKKSFNVLLYLLVVILFSMFMGFIGWLYLAIVNTGIDFLWIGDGEKLAEGFLYQSPFLILAFTTGGAFLLSLLQSRVGVYPIKPKVYIEDFKAQRRIEYNNFVGVFFMAMIPLFLGASVGPEASLVSMFFMFYTMTKDIDNYLENKLQVSLIKNDKGHFKDNILANPLYLLKILIFYVVTLVTLSFFSAHDAFPPFYVRFDKALVTTKEIMYLLPLFIIGYFFTEFYWTIQKFVNMSMDKISNDKFKVTLTGFMIGICAIFFPMTILSGEMTSHIVLDQLMGELVITLLAVTFVKILLSHVSVAGHIKGGPIYPIMFSCFLLGAALAQMFGIDYTFTVLAIVSVMMLRIFKSFPGVYAYFLFFFNIPITTIFFIILYIIKKLMKKVEGSREKVLESYDDRPL